MDIVLSFIDSLEMWHFFLTALVFISISAFIGDSDILPWISFSLFLVGLLDYFGTGALLQLISAPIFLIVSIIFSRKYLYSDKQNMIAEDISSLVNQKVRVVSVNSESSFSGEGVAANGKRWNISHFQQEEIENGKYYVCKEIEGLTLLVDHQERE
jgi:membrane protein implicated in regulation of membrane protease activity|tara:strand:- start:870 stop:1337 length:468 start_codon:yes stop_codon:yes gene_type:complete